MVPKGWKPKAFGDVVKLSKNKYDPQKSDKCFPCVELEHLTQETGQIVGSTPASTLGSIKNQFNSGDVIFGKLRPYLKKYAMPNFDGVCSSEIWVFAPTNEIINPYLYQFVQTNKFITEANKSAGSKMPRADWEVVSEMQLPLPPLPEQRKIAKILSTWDQAIATTERLIATSQQQKKALMQQLLTRKKRLVNPETGKEFEGEWEEVKLDDVISLGRGFAFKSDQYTENGTKIVRVTNIASSGHIDLSDCVYVPDEIAAEYQKYSLCNEDVLLVMVGATAGKLGFVSENILPSLLNQNMWSLRTRDIDVLSQLFLRHIAERIVSRYMLTQQGSARGFFTQSTFELVNFQIPPILEQQKIASVLTAADQEIELLEAKLTHLKDEKKALMQQLLTGKRRVKVDAAEVA